MATNAPGKAKIVLSGEDQTAAAFASVSRNFTALQGQVTGVHAKLLGITAAISAAFAAIGASRKIELLDQLDKLKEKTGLSAEELSILRFQGELANVPLEELAKGVQKLSKNMAEAAGGNKDAIATFAAMGISVKDGNGALKSQDVILGELADQFARYEDGPAKAALAQRIFGKSGADMIPLLNLGSAGLARQRKEAQELGLVLGGDLTRNAAEFNDNLTRLKFAAEAAAIAIGAKLLPELNRLLTNYLELKKEGLLGTVLKDAAKDVFGLGKLSGDPNADLRSLATERKRIVKDLEFAQKKGFATRDLEGELSSNTDLIAVSRIRQRSKALEDLGDTSDAVSRRLREGVKTQAPIVHDGSVGDQAAAVLRKQLDARLKAIKGFGEMQKAAIEFGNELAQSAYSAGFLSVQELFAQQREARDADLQSQLTEFDAIIKAQREFAAKAIKPEDRVKAEGEVAEVQAKRAKAELEHANKSAAAFEAERTATVRVKDAYDALGQSVLELQGRTLDAAKARIDRQLREEAIIVAQAGGDQRVIAQKRQLLTFTAELADVQQRYGHLTEAARDAEEALMLAAQQSGASELDTLSAIGAARQDSLVQLKALADAADELAKKLNTPEALAFARQLSLAFKKAAAEADPLLLRIRDIGKETASAIASDAEEAILHWGGFRKLLGAIEQDILRIATRKMFTEPFGNWLGTMMGGNGQASGGGGWLGQLFGSVFGGGGNVNLGTGSASFDAAIFGGWFAEGGTLRPGQWGIAGENGPEPIYAGDAPLSVMANGGGTVVNLHQNFTVTGPVNRETRDQIASSAFAGAQRALRRNG